MHGDDFLFVGSKSDLVWLKGQFEKQYACKIDIIGLCDGYPRTTRFLNRVISFTPNGIDFESDQRLVEALVEGLGLQQAKPSTSPGTKHKPLPKDQHQLIMERRLSGEGGPDATIANLKSEIGRLRAEISEHCKQA